MWKKECPIKGPRVRVFRMKQGTKAVWKVRVFDTLSWFPVHWESGKTYPCRKGVEETCPYCERKAGYTTEKGYAPGVVWSDHDGAWHRQIIEVPVEADTPDLRPGYIYHFSRTGTMNKTFCVDEVEMFKAKGVELFTGAMYEMIPALRRLWGWPGLPDVRSNDDTKAG